MTDNLNGLGRLFPGFGTLKSEITQKVTLAAGGLAGIVGGNLAAAYVPDVVAGTALPAWVKPALKIVAGAVLGPMIERKVNRKLGEGIGLGLTLSGVVGVVNAFAPSLLPSVQLGAADDALLLADGFSGAALNVETPAAFGGAALEVETPLKFGGVSGTGAGIASVLQ